MGHNTIMFVVNISLICCLKFTRTQHFILFRLEELKQDIAETLGSFSYRLNDNSTLSQLGQKSSSLLRSQNMTMSLKISQMGQET